MNLLRLFVAWLALMSFQGSAAPFPAFPAEEHESHRVQISMKNVMYHYSDAVAAHIFRLQGELLPVKDGTIVVFDDKNSFTLSVAYAEIAIGCNSLARVLNENVFSGSEAPIKNLTIESKDGKLLVKGEFHQGNVPFETTGTLSADPDGKIRLHAEHIKAAHLPVRGLLDLLGIDLARLIHTNQVRGVTVEKDDLILDPGQILPLPRLQGKVTAVRVQGDQIVQVFGTPRVDLFAPRQAGNYIAFRHGEMRFGKLTMHDSDLIMIDMDPRDPFDFFLDHYQEQLVAGYTKSTPEYGLRTYTRDYDKLPRHRGPSSLPKSK